jgi:hypothetical protein
MTVYVDDGTGLRAVTATPLTDLLALSVRQPWAWAIIFAGKDIENRSPFAVQKFVQPVRRRIAVHAAKGMTREEYLRASDFMRGIGVVCPPPAALIRGAVIGSVYVADVVKASESPWFFGPRGLVLKHPEPCQPVPAVGALGYFRWSPGVPSMMPPPARWMLPRDDGGASEAAPVAEPDSLVPQPLLL